MVLVMAQLKQVTKYLAEVSEVVMHTFTSYWAKTRFYIYEPSAIFWKDEGGIFIFCGYSSKPGLWLPQYVEHSKSLAARIPNHELWESAASLGATHIHAKLVQEIGLRKKLAEHLIKRYRPVLNGG